MKSNLKNRRRRLRLLGAESYSQFQLALTDCDLKLMCDLERATA